MAIDEMDTAADLIAALDALLEDERQALVTGDLENLQEYMEQKSAIIDRLNSLDDLNAEQLAPVQSKVQRNQALLGGALDGIRAVADRMAEMRRVRQGLETYDRSGQRTSLSAPSRPKVERRA
ncbi:flagellar export chaperone FlgN [Chachezhania antarctica]|uniref:flagellar export chaperone FlgN n=1 Tax=Chachezhania antarctica TaxID=2340860 RepID=UPI000EAFF894|nr:flagellar export chaperone FlgN [Chachezhania antarctica]|tara:strand:- start:1046 stop:1414 length:369 start_codon:yes stop_codon:yes gene_type:complete